MVLVGILSVMAGTLRSHVNMQLRGEVSAWSLVALEQLNRDLADATYVQLPALPVGTTNNRLAGCKNYSPALAAAAIPGGARYDATANVVAFLYCKTNGTAAAPVMGIPMPALLRYEASGAALTCPASIPAVGNCGDAPTPGVTVAAAVRNFHHRDDDGAQTPALFTRVFDGVEMHFAVGSGSQTMVAGGPPQAQIPVPVTIKVDTLIRANKPWGALLGD